MELRTKSLLRILSFLICILFGYSGYAQVTISPGVLNTKDLGILISGEKRTTFDPAKHGFHFENSFYNKVTNEIVTGGRCYGMVYTALDYFNTGKPIPRIDYRPSDNTRLSKYLYNRQVGVLFDADVTHKFTELSINPFGARTTEFFNWGLQGFNGGRLEELKEAIDANRPVPLGLYRWGSSDFASGHHAVLAIGYKMGRYKGDLKEHKEDFRVLVYDPNKPKAIRYLKPVPSKSYYVWEDEDDVSENRRNKWMTYFVDNDYEVATPPTVPQPRTYANDGKIYELLFITKTGEDDLRGRNDNLNVKVYLHQEGVQEFKNINAGERWVGGSLNYAKVQLKKGYKPEEIRKIEIMSTFTGGIGGDNWDMEFLKIWGRQNNKWINWKTNYCAKWNSDKYKCDSNPLMRFTKDQFKYTVNSPHKRPDFEREIKPDNKPVNSDKIYSMRVKIKSKHDILAKGNKLRVIVNYKDGTKTSADLTNGEQVERGTMIEKEFAIPNKRYGEIANITFEKEYGPGFLRLGRWRMWEASISYSTRLGSVKKGRNIMRKHHSLLHDFRWEKPKKVYPMNN